MRGLLLFRMRIHSVMNALSFLALILGCVPAIVSAQVAVIPSAPPYNIQVLPGSTRQINVNITGGTLNTVNWSVLSTTGGASATFTTPAASNVSSISAGIPTVQVNIGPGTGNCTIPQAQSAAGTYTVTSTATVTVKAQSVDDPTKTGTFLFNVCAKTTTVMIAPAYQQAFMGQHRMLQSWVSGDTDETGTWSIVAQPSGGNGVLADTTNRDADFVATVTGRYTLQYTSHSNTAKSSTAIVYVSPNPLPSYVSTPSKTEPRECYVDPAFTGGDYEVGAGKQYASLESTPAAGSLAPGSIIRVWNTDTTGTNPSTYHEYYQIASTGTATQPMILCGIPDSLGNLPVIDGSNATGQAGVSTDGAAAGAGVVSVWEGGYGHGSPYGVWQNGSAGPSYVTVTGLHIAHGTPDYNYTPPGGGTPTAYEAFTGCLNIRSGSYIDLGGNDLDTCGLGLFTDENGAEGWSAITQLVTMTGSHIENAGISGSETEHEAYFSSWYGLLQGNLWDNYNPQASGSAIKWRGVEGIFRYNNVASGAQRLFDLVDDEDSTNYITFEGYLGPSGDTNCDDSMYCLGDNAGPNILAAFQESFQKDFIYGNELFGTSALQQVHYLADGGSGMEDRNGTLYFYSNTFDDARIIFDTGSNGDGFYGYFPQRIDARNNIFWASTPSYTNLIEMAFGSESTIVMSATTNLMLTGTFTIQTPIEGAPWGDGTQEGWVNTCDTTPCLWPLSVPLNTHLYGLSNANYLTTATKPYNPTTMVPPAGSAAIDAGTALSGILQTMPVRWQYSIPTNSLTPRLNPQTIGAVDFAPTAVTPVFNPPAADYNTAQQVTISSTTPSSKIYYTTDGSTPTYPATGTTKLYGSPITVAATETVQAIAIAAGYVQSSVGSAAYGIGPLAATPTFSPAGGTYTAVQMVQISDTIKGATIYYTTDGSTPTTNSAIYNNLITISTNETLQAMAAAPGHSNSDVGSAAYTINIPQTPTPTFTPAGGSFTSTQTLKITDSITAAIYYTTDGSTPTTASTLYTGAITVPSSETLEAIAVATGDSPSAVAKAAFSITPPFAGPVFVQQCSNFVQYGTTISCTLTGVGAGHALAIGISNLTADQTGTATASSGTPVLAVTDSDSLSAWILPNTSAGSITITYTVGSNTRLWLSVAEFSNANAAPLDGVAQADFSTSWQGSGDLNTPSFTTTTASDLLWSFCSGDGGAPTVGTAPVAWTALPAPANSTLLVEDGNASSAGAYYGQCSSNEGEIVTMALKPAMPPPVLTSPTPGSTLAGISDTFTWTAAGAGNQGYWLFLGTTGVGSKDLYDSGQQTATSATFSSLPTNGETIYARVYTRYNGVLVYNDYTFTAAAQAVLTTPTPGSTLTSARATFNWTAATGSGNQGYWLFLGTTGVGSEDLYDSHQQTATSATFSSLPTNGETIYARVYTRYNGVLVYNDYTYTAWMQPPVMTSPAPGSTLAGTSQTFTWTPAGSGNQGYWLFLGTTGAGSKDLYDSGQQFSTSATFSSLPTNGETIYARVYTRYNGTLVYSDCTYSAAAQAVLTTPTPGSSFSGASATFDWTAATGSGTQGYWLFLGTTGVGSKDLYDSGQQTATSATFSTLPTNGETIYTRLYTRYNGILVYNDYTYKAK